MPYSNISQLPKQTDKLPKGAKTIFMNAYNNANKNGLSESEAMQRAWGAVKRVYRKVGDKWVKKDYDSMNKIMSTPGYTQQAPLVRENLAGGKKPKKKPKKQ